MIAYHIVLYVHLLALLAAIATSSVVHLAIGRAFGASSVAEIREWHTLAGRTARRFPIALLLLFASGAFMVGFGGVWSWSAGWVSAGMLGVVFLLASGAVLGQRGARTGRALAALGAGDIAAARAVLRDRVAGTLGWVNTGVALGVVYAMAAKPALLGSLLALVIGATAGLLKARQATRPAQAAPATAPSATELAA